MNITLTSAAVETIQTPALAVVIFEKDSGGPPTLDATLQTLDSISGGLITQLYSSGELSGRLPESVNEIPRECVLIHQPKGLAAQRLLLVGGGKAGEFDSARLRKAAGTAFRFLKNKRIQEFAFVPAGNFAADLRVAASAEGLVAADFEPDSYKTDKSDDRRVNRVQIAGDPSLQPSLDRAIIAAEAQNLARSLANEPANRLAPRDLVARAGQVAAENGLDLEVLDQERMRALGMGALLGVAQGSAEPPFLIVLRYRPSAPQSPSAPHLGLVGKAVTFDTGGISIKPAEGMEKMKYDMTGGATMIAVMRALSKLRPSIPVTAFIPTVENMPGSRAQRPGDVQTTMSGKTVEVINTDAEGRLILADALTYARQQGCTHLIDSATLTGAIVVALGYHNVGVFANDRALLDRLLRSARDCGEKMWPMPLDDEYKDQLKSVIADLPNVGTRWGGAITAAMFLKEFADPTPWVHLDVAGTAWLEESRPYMPKGPSGIAVRTLIDLAMRMGES